jgi:hypothetical protein
MTQDIYSKIERYSDLGFGIDILNNDKQALKNSVIPDDIKAKLAESYQQGALFAPRMSDFIPGMKGK